jgi:hypothetical protein
MDSPARAASTSVTAADGNREGPARTVWSLSDTNCRAGSKTRQDLHKAPKTTTRSRIVMRVSELGRESTPGHASGPKPLAPLGAELAGTCTSSTFRSCDLPAGVEQALSGASPQLVAFRFGLRLRFLRLTVDFGFRLCL